MNKNIHYFTNLLKMNKNNFTKTLVPLLLYVNNITIIKAFANPKNTQTTSIYYNGKENNSVKSLAIAILI